MTNRPEEAVVRRAAREARRRAVSGPETPVVSTHAVRNAATAAAVGAAVGAVRSITAARRRATQGETEPHGLERVDVAPARAPLTNPANGTAFERVLERGVDIVGDIRIRLRNVELLTIELRLPIAAASTPREIAPKE